MPPHLQPTNDAAPMTTREAFGMSLLLPEPEVLAAEMASINCRTLASIIAKLIVENEPLLKAECDGATVTVRERGGSCVMRVSVEAL